MLAAAHQNKRLLTFIVLISSLCFVCNLFADESALKAALSSVVAKADKGTQIAVHLVDLRTGEEVYAKNAELPLKPASTMKILTSIYALDKLGAEFYFLTPFLISQNGNAAPDLYVKGVGDPFLTTEFLWVAARKIKKLGVDQIRQVVIDNSAFIEPPSRQGQRSYMTGAAAMSFNFNSVNIEVCPGVAGKKAEVFIEPLEAPVKLINSVTTVLKGQSEITAEEQGTFQEGTLGSYEVKGKINIDDACKIITRSMSRPADYFAYTLEGFLKYLGIKIERKFTFGNYPNLSGRMFSQPTFPLSYIIKGLNHYSTNFIAEQILYALGRDGENRSFDREKGLERLSDFLKEVGIDSTECRIEDGSGLSHDNRLSAAALTKLLVYANTRTAIRNEFISSLPIAGVSGTLKKRNFDTSGALIRGKTGSLDGVNTLAGYIFSNKQKQYAFAIIQNQVKSREIALSLEEKIVDTITSN